MRILLTGATGLIGKELGRQLVSEGHQLVLVTRNKASSSVPFPCEYIEANLSQSPLPTKDLKNIDGVIHLMGESVASGRWTLDKKRRIYESRVSASENLVKSFKPDLHLKFIISASAIGIYGDRGEEFLHEGSNPGSGFLADVCRDWERPFRDLQSSEVNSHPRVLNLRIGLVLSSLGGAYPLMAKPFRLGLGGILGNGRQWMSWIHLQDLVRVVSFAIQNPHCHGVLNAVSPQNLTNRDFSMAMAKHFGCKLGPAVPAFALRLILGEMSSLLLFSQRVVPTNLEKWGFQFRFQEISQALAAL